MTIERLRALSLQTKIILLVIFIVGTVLSFSTYLSMKISEKALEEDMRERAVIVAQGLAAGIQHWSDLEDVKAIRKEIQAVMRTRGSLLRIGFFRLVPGGLALLTSSGEGEEVTLYEKGQKAVKRNMTVTDLRSSGEQRRWDVATPIYIGRRIVGAVAVEASLEQADQLAARQRRQFLAIMLVAGVLIAAILSRYLQGSVNRPIRALVGTMAKAEGGDLGVEVKVQRADELGWLAESFNRMLGRIKESYEQNALLLARVHNFNQELRLEVERATKELAERNEELRRVNEQLFDVQRRLTQSEQLAAIGQLAAMVAHEIGTPLNSISGHVQVLLQQENEDQEAVHRLHVIETQIARVVEILQDFLTASHPREPDLKPVDINALLMELLRLTEPAIGQKGIALSAQLDPTLPVLNGDPAQLQQVFLNLIANALDAMRGGGTLTLLTKPSADGNFVEVEISDTGQGIPVENLKRIFDPFFTTKEMGHGTGLGLAICQQIIKSHGGNIRVESQVERGTTFTVLLPAREG